MRESQLSQLLKSQKSCQSHHASDPLEFCTEKLQLMSIPELKKSVVTISNNGLFKVLPVEIFIQITSTLQDPRDWDALSQSSRSIRALMVDIKSFLFKAEIGKRFPQTLIKCYMLGKSAFLDSSAPNWGSALFTSCFPTSNKNYIKTTQKSGTSPSRSSVSASSSRLTKPPDFESLCGPKTSFYNLQRMQEYLKGMDSVIISIMRLFLKVSQKRMADLNLAQSASTIATASSFQISSPIGTGFVLGSNWEVTATLVLRRWQSLIQTPITAESEPQLKTSLGKLAHDLEKLKILAMRYLMLLFAIVEGSKFQPLCEKTKSINTQRRETSKPSPSPTQSTTYGITIPEQHNNAAFESHSSSSNGGDDDDSLSSPNNSQALVLSSTPPNNTQSSLLHVLHYRLLRNIDTDSLSGIALAYTTLQNHIQNALTDTPNTTIPTSKNTFFNCIQKNRKEDISVQAISTIMRELLHPTLAQRRNSVLVNPMPRELAVIHAMGMIEEGYEVVERFLNLPDAPMAIDSQQSLHDRFVIIRPGPYLWNAVVGVLREREDDANGF